MDSSYNIVVRPLSAELFPDAALTEHEALGSEGWSQKAIADTVALNGTYLGVFFDGKYAGHAGMTKAADEGYVTNIAVKPKFRRCGAATALIKALLGESERSKLAFLSLEVRASNTAAVSLYKKCGFKKAGLRPKFYRDPCEDAVIMTYYFEREPNLYENTRY